MTECIDGSRMAGPLHAAVVYDSDDVLRGGAAPFVRDGLDRGETIFAMLPSQVQLILRSVLATTVIACNGASPASHTGAPARRTKNAARSSPPSTPSAGPPGC